MSKNLQGNLFALAVLGCSLIFFVLGLSFPLLSTKTKVMGITLEYREVHLFDSVKMFFEEKEYLLAVIIFLFTIVLPVIKYSELINRQFRWVNVSEKLGRFLHEIDKWSMLDVFLVALLLLNFKMNSKIIIMQLKMGTSFLALSVILRMFSIYLFNKNKI